VGAIAEVTGPVDGEVVIVMGPVDGRDGFKGDIGLRYTW